MGPATSSNRLCRRGELPSIVRRTLGTTAALVVAAGLATAGPAQAGTAGGATFAPAVSCGASFVTFSVNSDQESGSYAKLWVYDPVTTQWTTDGQWIDATRWSSFHVADLTFNPGYYYFYLTYAQWTASGWSYSGELVQHYDQVLGSDEDFWHKVGIDPVRMMTSGGTYYTLRCYLDDQPIFLGRNGRVSVFTSGGALARYLADEHDHDLSDLATYDDIRTAATDGSLQVDVSDDNVYVLTGIADDLADGPDALDRDQLELAVELLRDVGEYAEDTIVDETLDADQPLGRVVAHVLDPDTVQRPSPPYAKAVEQWEALEAFVESRLRQE